MKTACHLSGLTLFVTGTLAAILVGCATTPETTSAPQGGTYVKNPHLDKVWLAEGFDFSGFDTLYIADTQVDASVKPHDDELKPMETARRVLREELAAAITEKKIFASVVTSESDIKPGSKALRWDNTIVEYTKGGGGARYFVGLYGGGQPAIKVRGKMAEGEKALFTFDGRRSGVSAGARMGGAFMTDEAIQAEDIRSLVKDLSDFMDQTARRQPGK
jgi:hypothetical protein